MTKVLVIGNSHTGALRSAREAFAKNHPEIELSFFAAPGILFKRGRIKKDGHFYPKPRTQRDRDLILKINGSHDIDTRPFDHLLVVGHRPDMLKLRTLALEYGRLGGQSDKQASRFLISDGLLEAWMADIVLKWAQDVGRRFGKVQNVTVTDAPYRSISLLGESGARQEADRFKQLLSVEYVDALMQKYFQLMAAHLQEWGLNFLPQPEHTRAGPYSTKPEFCQDGVGPQGQIVKRDHRHMNTDFGHELLEAFLKQSVRQSD